jgi:hypothetical protein
LDLDMSTRIVHSRSRGHGRKRSYLVARRRRGAPCQGSKATVCEVLTVLPCHRQKAQGCVPGRKLNGTAATSGFADVRVSC